MAFPDSIKKEALSKAHFKCVACHDPFVEVHHITPQSEGGPDTLDNAAPLCAGCHHTYGANPVYRKQIRQMRDLWYDICEKRFSPSGLEFGRQLNELNETLRTVQAGQVKYQDTLEEIKSVIADYMAGTVSAVKGAETFEEIVGATGSTGPDILVPPCKKGFCSICNSPSFDDGLGSGKCINCGTTLI